MSHAEPASDDVVRDEAVESPRERHHRHAQRGRLYITALLMAALIVAIVALVTANTRRVEISWVFGSTMQSLAWIVVVTALLGWLLGMVTSVLFRRRTRAPQK